MQKSTLFITITSLAGLLFAADPEPKDDVRNAIKQLGEKANYSWQATETLPERFKSRPEIREGKTEKEGFTYVVTVTSRTNTWEAVITGDKALFNDDGGWEFVAVLHLSKARTPVWQAAELVAGVSAIKREGAAYSGDLTEESAKMFTGLTRDGVWPKIKNAKGSVKFWIKDGMLSKYEFHVQGSTVDFGIHADNTTIVEIKDVGTTKVEVPEGAKKKLG